MKMVEVTYIRGTEDLGELKWLNPAQIIAVEPATNETALVRMTGTIRRVRSPLNQDPKDLSGDDPKALWVKESPSEVRRRFEVAMA